MNHAGFVKNCSASLNGSGRMTASLMPVEWPAAAALACEGRSMSRMPFNSPRLEVTLFCALSGW